MNAIGRPDLASRADLAENPGRWALREELDAAIEEWTSARSRSETLLAAGVPGGPIATAADIAADSQYAARNMIQYFDIDTGAGVRRVGFPGVVPVIGGRSLPIRSLGPDLGEHNQEVLAGSFPEPTEHPERELA